MTNSSDVFYIIKDDSQLTQLSDCLHSKAFRPITEREVAPRQKFFITNSDDDTSRYAITGNNAYTDNQEVFLEFRPKGKGLLLTVPGNFFPDNARFKKAANSTDKTTRYETLITDVKDIDEELVAWVHASYDSFIPKDTRSVDEKKKDWEEMNAKCLAEAYRGGVYGPQFGYEAIALATVVFGKDSIEWADSNKNIALVYFYQGYPDSALKFSNYAYPVAEKLLQTHFDAASEILHQHAVVLQANKEYAAAEKMYKKVLKLRQKSETVNKTVIAQSLGDLARLYAETDKSSEAEKTNIQARDTLLEYMNELQDKQSDAYYSALYNCTIVNSNIAMHQREGQQYDQALDTYKAIATALEEVVALGGQPQESLLKNVFANMQKLREEYPAAKSKLKESAAKVEKLIPPEAERTEYQEIIDYLLKH